MFDIRDLFVKSRSHWSWFWLTLIKWVVQTIGCHLIARGHIQTQIQEYFLKVFGIFARATYYLTLKHALKNFGNKRLTLHFVFYILVVAKTRINQILQEEIKEFLCIALLTNFKLVANFIYQNDNRNWHNAFFSLIPLKNGCFHVIFQDTETAEILIVQRNFDQWIILNNLFN